MIPEIDCTIRLESLYLHTFTSSHLHIHHTFNERLLYCLLPIVQRNFSLLTSHPLLLSCIPSPPLSHLPSPLLSPPLSLNFHLLFALGVLLLTSLTFIKPDSKTFFFDSLDSPNRGMAGQRLQAIGCVIDSIFAFHLHGLDIIFRGNENALR